MLISILLILCLHWFKAFCESDEFLKEPNWKWDYACVNHPFAVGLGIPKVNLNDVQIGKRCTLTFDYPVMSSNDGSDAFDFCRLMFPDRVLREQFEPTPVDGKVKCVYQRASTCENEANGSYPIGDKCVTIVKNNPKTYADAKNFCATQGFQLLDLADYAARDVVHFLSKLYSFDQPTQALWVNVKELNSNNFIAHLHYTRYSAIGDKRPGTTEKADEDDLKNRKATVVCVKNGDKLPADKKDYCKMVSEFMKIRAGQIGSTCYSTTQSVMTARPNPKNSKLATIDHFNDMCRARYGELNFPVAPRSEEQMKALDEAAKYPGKPTQKRGLLLPAAMTDYFDRKTNMSLSEKELLASLFAYKIAGKNKKKDGTPEIEILGVSADNLWNSPNYPTRQLRMGVTPGVLYWNIGKIENVEQFRRSPIVCGTGPAVVSAMKCPADFPMGDRTVRWEIAHRSDGSALCYVVQKGGFPHNECPTLTNGQDTCKKYGAELAPMESPEEEMAIARAVAQAWGTPDHTEGGVLLGAYSAELNSKYVWHMTGESVGSKYQRFISAQPDHHALCTGGFLGIGRDCHIREQCMELYFGGGGRPLGLNDVFCDKPCASGHLLNTVACAVRATKVDL